MSGIGQRLVSLLLRLRSGRSADLPTDRCSCPSRQFPCKHCIGLLFAFVQKRDSFKQEYIDTGVWMNLGTGRVQLTQNFRPYKAAKYIQSDDSFFQVAQVSELCVYRNCRTDDSNCQPSPSPANSEISKCLTPDS